MGEVFRARDARLGRDVAIKALPEAFATDPERLARFEREARLLASLNHPNVAGIHGVEEVGGHRYLVLEFVEGETLAERLTRGPIPVEEAMEVCRDIAAGVEAAHESGVVHRDLKPGNVIITPSGQVKVLDFGLATSGGGSTSGSDPNLSHSPTMTHATRAGVILGTAAYMSPEQARGKAVDRRTDVWSFGCVLYECLTGRQLHHGETVSDLIARILEREPDWTALPVTTPSRVRDLLKRCLRKDAKERLRDIGDARIELSEAIAHPETAAIAAAPVAKTRSSRIPWVIAALAVAAAVASLVLMRPAPHPVEQKTMRLSIALPSDLTVSVEPPDVTLSPDGTATLFSSADSSGTSHLYVRPLNAVSVRLLPGTNGAVIPFWSPDSKQIAFFADGNLKRMGINDDGAQVICPAPSARGGDWGPGNVIVFAPAASGPLMQVPASGGTPTPATTLDATTGETAHRFPQFLPDGKHFLYVALPGQDNLNATRVGTLDATIGPVLLSASGRATYAAPGYLLFLQNGSVLAQPFDTGTLTLSGSPVAVRGLKDATGQYSGSPVVASSHDGTLIQREVLQNDTHLVLVDRSGRTLRRLALPAGVYWELRFSPDASRLAATYSKSGEPAHEWLIDIARNITTRFSFEGNFDVAPVWTPDGARIIWGSDRAGGRNLYWKNADGSGKEELLFDAPGLFNDPNSAEAGVLIFRSLSGETNEDIWTVPLSGEPSGKPLIQSRFNENDGALSPDGRWLAYRCDESGRMEIYVTSFPLLDQRVQVSNDGSTPGTTTGLTLIRWRKDGRELYYIGPDARSVIAVPVETGEKLDAGVPKALFKLPRETIAADIAPDGQMLVLSIPAQEGRRSVVNLFMNWSQELGTSK
jgi:serine/threonine protein kinase/dipeptidyl aminopeptidase/acylaminoacyl peptidase